MTTDRGDELGRRADDARIGWEFVHVRQLLGQASIAAAEVMERLDGFDAELLGTGAGVAISAAEIDDAANGVLAVHDLVDSAAILIGRSWPRQDPVVLSSHEICASAAAALASGSADQTVVVLAARLLPVATGYRALAEALEDDPSLPTHWEELTVVDLLATFRGSDNEHIGQLCDEVRVHPDAAWAQLDLSIVGRIAAALRRAAGG